MEYEVTFEAYLRYARQQAPPAEIRAVRAWLADPANALLAQAWMHQYAQQLEQQEGPAPEMPDFENIHNQLLAQLELAPIQNQNPRAKWPYWAAAAVLLLGLLVGGPLLWPVRTAAPPALTQLTTANGERRTVQLPDGSSVLLNGHSTLRYAAGLGQMKTREVWLEGEGYFSVKHLPDHRRFVVHTGAGFSVEVLGTQFTVYRRHRQARVVLLAGKVRADFADKARSRAVLLRPGELLETNDLEPRHIVHEAVNVALYSAWKDNKLVFDETTLAEVATRLSDTYGVKVVVQDTALNQRRVSGSFPIEDLETVLQFLEKSFQLTARREAQQITLSSPSFPVSQ